MPLSLQAQSAGADETIRLLQMPPEKIVEIFAIAAKEMQK